MAAEWDDLVVADEVLADLRLLVEWTRAARREGPDRPAGPVALFSGPSGTGKTLAAQVVARAAEVPLFRPDHAADGPLRARLVGLCEAASACGAALLLDGTLIPPGGADQAAVAVAVRDAVAANHELVVIEATGPADVHPLLAASAVAQVRFQHPDAAQRAALWRRALPAAASDVLDRVGQLPLTGRQIRMAAAAATSATDGRAVGAADLLHACRLVGAATSGR